MPTYQGHKNWNHWNVALWINNDEGLYALAKQAIRVSQNRTAAAETLLIWLSVQGDVKTPDGAPYSVSSLRAAMVGM